MKFFTPVFTALLLLAGAFAFQGVPGALAAGDIVLDGSTTVLPIAQNAAEQYMDSHQDTNISVRGGGSSVGITSLISGTCDIADSSRPMKAEELKKAREKGINAVPNVIAMDGIAVVVNNANKISGLTRRQIKDIYTGVVSDWSQVGGKPGRIVVVSRDSASGTYEAFGELALAKAKVRPQALLQASNQAVAATVAQAPGAIGYIGLGYVTKKVKAVKVDGVEATRATVLSGKYPLSRPLFMITKGEPKGAVKLFLDYIKGPEGRKLVEAEGFVHVK